MDEGEIYNAFLGTEMEVGERKGGWPLCYLSSTIKFHILASPKRPEHRVLLSSSSPWFLSNVRRGRDNTERGGGGEIIDIAHSVTCLLLLTRSLRSECVCLVEPSGKKERVGGGFVDLLRRDISCIIIWNLRLTCETEGLKAERSSSEVAIKTTSGCWPILPVLFCCLFALHPLESKSLVTSLW